MSDIFISYSSKDQQIADTLCSQLENNGYSCWIAHRDIIPGEDWARKINTAITSAKVFIVIYSRNSSESTQVPKEIGIAGARNIAIIPYKIDDTPLAGDFEYYLLGSHWVSADPYRGDYKIGDILNAVEYAIARREGREPSSVIINNNYAGDNNSVINFDQKVFWGKAFKAVVVTAVLLLLVAAIIIIVLLMGKINEDDSPSQPDVSQSVSTSDDLTSESLTHFEAEAIYNEMVHKLMNSAAVNAYSEFVSCFDDTYDADEVAEIYSTMQFAVELSSNDISMFEYTDDTILGMYCFYENAFDGIPMHYHSDFVDNANVLVRNGDEWLFSRLPDDHPLKTTMDNMLYPYGANSDSSYTFLSYQTVTANVLCDHMMVEVDNVTKNDDGTITVRYQIINGDYGFPTDMRLRMSVYDYFGNELLSVDEMPMDTDISENEIQMFSFTTEPFENIDSIDLTLAYYDAYVNASYG